jgi:hypothetical protein
MSGSCVFDLTWSIPELTRGSNLSGPFYLVRASSTLGLLIALFLPPVRYLNMSTDWALGKKYEGTDR